MYIDSFKSLLQLLSILFFYKQQPTRILKILETIVSYGRCYFNILSIINLTKNVLNRIQKNSK